MWDGLVLNSMSQNRERNEQGHFLPTLSTTEIYAVLLDADNPVLSTMEVAEGAECSREGAYQKLTALEAAGRVRKKKVGARAVVWWALEPEEGT